MFKYLENINVIEIERERHGAGKGSGRISSVNSIF